MTVSSAPPEPDDVPVQATTESELELYLFDKKSQTFVKLKPDYSNRVPLASAHTKGVRELKGAKADKQLGVIVPLTKRRPNSSDYVQLATIARKYPRIDTIAVINPTLDRRGVGVDGPGPDPEYQNAIRFLQANGIRVIGYIATGEGLNKTFEECRNEIDKWKDWYPDIQGVFLDEMSSSLDKLDYYKRLDEHAKKSREMILTVGDMAHGRAVGDAVKEEEGGSDDAYLHNTGINIFIVYENRGYPAENWYAAYKKEWTPNYGRSRFAWLVFGVSDNDVLACNNFIDKVVAIEGLAGYVMVQPELGVPNDQRSFADWDTLSPYLETILISLDRQAHQERLPFTKGVSADTAKVESAVDRVGPQTVSEESPPTTPERGERDNLGIAKIYPSKQGGLEWQSEYQPLPEVLKEQRIITIPAGGDQKLLNQEITGYFRFVGPLAEGEQKQLLAIHTRTGPKDFTTRKKSNNKNTNSCEISGYIGILSSDGSVHVRKQIDAETMTGTRAGTQMTNESLENRWIGIKFIVGNYQVFNPQERKESTAVRMEFYVDDNVTDLQKNLVVKNSWQRIMITSDEGGWMAQNVKVPKTAKDGSRIISKCPSLNKPDFMGREIDEIIVLPGGTEESNCAIIEMVEGTEFRYISTREIYEPDRD